MRSRPSGSRRRSAGRSGSSRRPTRGRGRDRARGPAADARAPVLRRADADRGREPAPAADLRGRGHPLGRRGHARPDRVPGPLGPRPGAARLPGPRRAPRPPPRLGRRAPERDHARRSTRSPRSTRASWSARCSASGGASEELAGPGRQPLGRQPAVRRGDGQPDPRGGRGRGRGAARDGPLGARRAARLAAALGAPRASSAPRSSARRSGRARSPTPASRALDLRATLESLRAKDLVVPTAGSRLAGEREYAFKHVLIRDVAYSTLPKAVRARQHAEVGEFISDRAADRSEGVVAMVAEHYSRAAALGAAADLEPGELHDDPRPGARGARGGRRRVGGDLLEQRGAGPLRGRAGARRRPRPGDRRPGRRRSSATSPCGSAASTARSRAWDQCMEYHRGEEDLARVGDLHRKIGAGLWHKGDREGSIEHYQRGIDLLKDGPPCLELVRLYEEAASLYMHTGDNMLAIYASEKALRLAERLGEAAAASRAHGIFGRVFGRIGDSERARENLERSVELARETDPGGGGAGAARARLPPRGLRGRLRGRARDVRRGARARRRDRRPAVAGRAPRGARPARRLPRRLGGGRARDRRLAGARRARGPGRQALLPVLDARRAALARRRARRIGGAARARVRDRRPGRPLRGRLRVARLAGQHPAGARATTPTPTRRSPGRSTSASAPAWSPSRSRRPPPAPSTPPSGARPRPPRAWPRRRPAWPSACATRSGRAASLEASGAAAAEPEERERLLTEAREAWEALGRPLDAERCAALLAGV